MVVRYAIWGAQDNELGCLKLDENTSDYTFVFKDRQIPVSGRPTKDVTFTVVAVDEHNAVSKERELTFTIRYG